MICIYMCTSALFISATILHAMIFVSVRADNRLFTRVDETLNQRLFGVQWREHSPHGHVYAAAILTQSVFFLFSLNSVVCFFVTILLLCQQGRERKKNKTKQNKNDCVDQTLHLRKKIPMK